jgi:hypothetical protein
MTGRGRVATLEFECERWVNRTLFAAFNVDLYGQKSRRCHFRERNTRSPSALRRRSGPRLRRAQPAQRFAELVLEAGASKAGVRA